jgi:hypothetical protein
MDSLALDVRSQKLTLDLQQAALYICDTRAMEVFVPVFDSCAFHVWLLFEHLMLSRETLDVCG